MEKVKSGAMQITVLAFGIAKEITGFSSQQETFEAELNAGMVKTMLEQRYPELKRLTSFALAVNGEYVPSETEIRPGDEIAIIPPVSGG